VESGIFAACIEAVPEPANAALAVFGVLLSVTQLVRFLRRRKALTAL
jgi:hypothetical protein